MFVDFWCLWRHDFERKTAEFSEKDVQGQPYMGPVLATGWRRSWPPVTAKQQFLWSIWNGWDKSGKNWYKQILCHYANIKELQTASTCSSCSLIWGIFPKRPYFNEKWVSLYVSWVWGCHTFRRPTWMVGKPCSFLAGVGGSELCDVLRPGIHTLKYPVLEPRFFPMSWSMLSSPTSTWCFTW